MDNNNIASQNTSESFTDVLTGCVDKIVQYRDKVSGVCENGRYDVGRTNVPVDGPHYLGVYPDGFAEEAASNDGEVSKMRARAWALENDMIGLRRRLASYYLKMDRWTWKESGKEKTGTLDVRERKLRDALPYISPDNSFAWALVGCALKKAEIAGDIRNGWRLFFLWSETAFAHDWLEVYGYWGATKAPAGLGGIVVKNPLDRPGYRNFSQFEMATLDAVFDRAHKHGYGYIARSSNKRRVSKAMVPPRPDRWWVENEILGLLRSRALRKKYVASLDRDNLETLRFGLEMTRDMNEDTGK